MNFMNEILIVFKEIVDRNTILTNIMFLMFFLSFIILIVLHIYNKIYVSNHKGDFLDLFFGKQNGAEFTKVGGDVLVIAYWFTTYYSSYKIFSMKVFFPSLYDKDNKPLSIMPNTYKENIDIFELKHKKWLIINLGSIYLALIFFISFLVYGLFF